MEFSTFQQVTRETSMLPLGGPQGLVAPLLGLASETGSILNVYKKYLRDGIDLDANRAFLKEELGDLLWYAAAVATACGLDLDDVASHNIERTRRNYLARREVSAGADLPVFDATYPSSERFPRRLVIEFREYVQDGRMFAQMRLLSAEPNSFPDGQIQGPDGKPQGFTVGADLGDPLTDNSRLADAYRYHDAIHFGFMAVLGWSPNLRSLLRLKRKSNPETDEVEDGARAIFAEEGLAAILSRLAPRRLGFATDASIDTETVEVATATVSELEVDVMPGWLWKSAIRQGFTSLHALKSNSGGHLVADLDERTLTYQKLYTPKSNAS
jgi:NTP pyrophosphatase (non-canonical NTP hydrolase)